MFRSLVRLRKRHAHLPSYFIFTFVLTTTFHCFFLFQSLFRTPVFLRQASATLRFSRFSAALAIRVIISLISGGHQDNQEMLTLVLVPFSTLVRLILGVGHSKVTLIRLVLINKHRIDNKCFNRGGALRLINQTMRLICPSSDTYVQLRG